MEGIVPKTFLYLIDNKSGFAFLEKPFNEKWNILHAFYLKATRIL